MRKLLTIFFTSSITLLMIWALFATLRQTAVPTAQAALPQAQELPSFATFTNLAQALSHLFPPQA